MCLSFALASLPSSPQGPIEALQRALRAEWLASGGVFAIEVALVSLASLLLGWLLFQPIAKLVSLNHKAKEVIRAASGGKGIKRSSTLFLGTLVFDGIVAGLKLTELASSNVSNWVLFFRILALGWLSVVAYESALILADERGAIQGDKQRKILLPFLRKLGIVSILAISLVTALAVVGTNVWGMVAGLGIGGIAVAFAAKDSVENIFGSFTVVLDMPFGVGDWIKVGPVEGIVEEINLRSTRIRTFEDSLITLPNSNFIKASVENLGQRRSRRVKTTLHLSVPKDADALEAYVGQLADAIAALPECQRDSCRVTVFELKETSAVVQVIARFEVGTYTEELVCRQQILLAAIRLAGERDLHLLTQPQ